MAASKQGEKYTVRVEYKPSFDESGALDLDAYSQTFTKVKETATPSELKAYADALMSLTVYHNAPYKVTLIDTSFLVNA